MAPVTDDNDKMPEPKIDEGVERAPGGADATTHESDVGAGVHPGSPVTPDQPLSAQTDEKEVPDELQESEGPDETIDDSPAEPEVSPTD